MEMRTRNGSLLRQAVDGAGQDVAHAHVVGRRLVGEGLDEGGEAGAEHARSGEAASGSKVASPAPWPVACGIENAADAAEALARGTAKRRRPSGWRLVEPVTPKPPRSFATASPSPDEDRMPTRQSSINSARSVHESGGAPHMPGHEDAIFGGGALSPDELAARYRPHPTRCCAAGCRWSRSWSPAGR